MSEVDSASDCSLPAGDSAQSTIELAGTVDDGDANNSSNNIETALVKRSSIEIPVTIETTAMSSPILQLDRFTEIGIHVDESSSHLDVSCSDTGDLSFLVKGREFVASKTVLSSKSPIFAALLEQKPSTRYIVSSIDGDVFAAMLDYIRTGRIGDELTKHAADLLEVAHKFEVSNLKDICEDYLQNNFSSESIINVFLLADKTNCARLKQKAMQFIDEHCPTLVNTADFEKVLQHRPQLGLELYRYVTSRNDF